MKGVAAHILVGDRLLDLRHVTRDAFAAGNYRTNGAYAARS
jgi:hypothetical protein